ncbi:unnamed protein product, partial [Caenorhabditis angaria]
METEALSTERERAVGLSLTRARVPSVQRMTVDDDQNIPSKMPAAGNYENSE